jgi:hypothetical protein
MLLGGPQNTIKNHLVFTALFCFAPFSVFSSRMIYNSALTNSQSLLHAELHVLRGPRSQDAGIPFLLLLEIFVI